MAEELIDPIDPVEPVAEIPAADAAPAPEAPAVEDITPPADQDVVVAAEPIVHEGDPTLEEAQAMFPENPGLDAVRTQSGWLTREGVLHPLLSGE